MEEIGDFDQNFDMGLISTSISPDIIHEKKDFCGGDGYFGQKKLAEKVRKSRQNVNRDKSA